MSYAFGMVFLPFDETRFGNQLQELDRYRASLDARPLVMGWQGQLASDLMAEAIQASTNMEGVPVTVEEVRRILAGDRPSNVTVEDASLVTGYADAMEYCQRRADDDVFDWSPELIKAIQDKILAGRSDRGAGRYGRGRYVTDSLTGALIYTPPQENVGALVTELCDQMNTWGKTLHPALASAWVHVALAAIHPFKDGNGRTARVLASLAMYRGQFRRREFTSLEEWWGRHRVTYANAFKCLGSEFSRASDVTPFIEAHIGAQISQVRAIQHVERTIREVWDGLVALATRLKLPPRTVVAMWDIFNGRSVTRPYYAVSVGLKEGTAKADLRVMAAVGILMPEGNTRARRWVEGPAFFPQLGGIFGVDPESSNKDSILASISGRVMREAIEIARSDTETFTSAPAYNAPPSSAATSTGR